MQLERRPALPQPDEQTQSNTHHRLSGGINPGSRPLIPDVDTAKRQEADLTATENYERLRLAAVAAAKKADAGTSTPKTSVPLIEAKSKVHLNIFQRGLNWLLDK